MSNAGKNPVFIFGSPRSGTTILIDAIRSGGYFGFNEGHFLNLIPIVQNAVNAHFDASVAHDPHQLLSNIDRDDFLSQLFRVFRTVQSDLNTGGPWVDKTPDPDMIRAIPVLAKLWPTAGFVFARRRGIETIKSRSMKFHGPTFEQHCVLWAETMFTWREVVRSKGLCAIEIDQYDTARYAQATSQRLGHFLGMDDTAITRMQEEMTNSTPQRTDEASTHQVHSLQTVGWTPEQIAIFQAHCSGEMTAYGYTLDERYRLDDQAGSDSLDNGADSK